MQLVKNTYGISAIIDPKVANPDLLNTLGGSSLDRKKSVAKKKEIDTIEELLKKPLLSIEEKVIPARSMSPRTRSKIRIKLMALARVHKNLSFLTLTFVNQVTDQTAIKALRTFLDNAKKRLPDFEYLWVAERQTNNEVFKDNIHFHIITNKFWKIDKWWQYWLDVQAKFGIVTRDESFKPSSAFNVRKINTDNVKQLGGYLTKYVTKNSSSFNCQVWNCSKKISRLYTSFYSGINFIKHLEKLEAADLLGGTLKVYQKEFCNICIIPLNRTTIQLYHKIDDKNKAVWNGKSEVVDVNI